MLFFSTLKLKKIKFWSTLPHARIIQGVEAMSFSVKKKKKDKSLVYWHKLVSYTPYILSCDVIRWIHISTLNSPIIELRFMLLF